MFMRITANRTSGPNSLLDLGMTTGSNPIVSLNEFTYEKGTEIYGEKEPAEYVYQVKTGAVRTYKLLTDGRRQIGAFHLVGDIFGLENGNEHRFTAEAVVRTTLRLIKRQSLELVAKSDSGYNAEPPHHDHPQSRTRRKSYAAAGSQNLA